jgi:deazaflavin-dependent oxidoreductase (nitroreductase family)
MSTETSSAPGGGPQAPQTMAYQGFVNRIMLGLLATPGVSSGIGKYLITLYVVGRKSGRHYDVPVAYVEHEGALLVGTSFGWAKNLRTGEPVDVRLKGKRRTADVEVIRDETSVVALYDVICRHNKNFAKFNKITIEPDGSPRPAELREAWQAGARVIRLTPR